MNSNLDIESIFIITFILFAIIIVSKKIIDKENSKKSSKKGSKKNNEHFSGGTPDLSKTKFEQLTDDSLMSQRHERARNELVLNTVDDSIKNVVNKQGKLRFESANKHSDLLDTYMNKMIKNDVGNPNNLLIADDPSNPLPSLLEEDYEKFNHEFRKINLSKQIKQNYIIKVMRHKIDLLLNSIKPINEIKEDHDFLKKPENRHIVNIINKHNGYIE